MQDMVCTAVIEEPAETTEVVEHVEFLDRPTEEILIISLAVLCAFYVLVKMFCGFVIHGIALIIAIFEGYSNIRKLKKKLK